MRNIEFFSKEWFIFIIWVIVFVDIIKCIIVWDVNIFYVIFFKLGVYLYFVDWFFVEWISVFISIYIIVKVNVFNVVFCYFIWLIIIVVRSCVYGSFILRVYFSCCF